MLRTLFLDFNAYFASVEQQAEPKLRGKPVAVVPVMADSTCCIAASYEAKAFGIRTGTRVSEARKRCRDLILVEARHALYIETHHRLLKVIDTCAPVAKVMSIDELTIDLDASQRQRDVALALAAKIKRTIARDAGECLRSSIGIAPNPLLAKLASDLQKPDGCVVIEQQELPQRLYGIPLNALYGIGDAMLERLARVGISTMEQLTAASKTALRRAWGGIEGERFYERLRGEIVHTPPTRRSSISHSHVLPPELRNPESAHAVLSKLLQKAAMRLRHGHYLASGLQVYVRFFDRRSRRKFTWVEQAQFDATQDSLQLLHALDVLWHRQPREGLPPFAVGVVLFNLRDRRQQSLSLFAEDVPRDELNSTVDRINARFGKNAIYFGGAHQALAAAPMRIAFTHIPDTALEDV